MFRDLACLFASPARIKILKYFALQPNIRADISMVAKTLALPRAFVEKEGRALVRFSILEKRQTIKNALLALNAAHPLAEPLRAFFETATSLSDSQILSAFRKVRVALLVATGVLVGESRASVDLLVVTKTQDTAILAAIRRLEAIIALPVRYAVLAPEEYQGRLQSYDRLLRDVFEYKHRMIVGKDR